MKITLNCNKIIFLKICLLLLATQCFIETICTIAKEKNDAPENKLEFVIIVPSYNNAANNGKWIRKNLESVANQRSTNPYKVYLINDCSTDQTKRIMDEQVKKNKLESLVHVIHNAERVGALANIYNTVHKYCKNSDIVVLVDGDDAVIPKRMLEILEAEYKDPNCWATYGSFVYYPSAVMGFNKQIPSEVTDNKSFRNYDFVFQGLRTFNAGLFKKIQKSDLIYEDGKFFQMAWDVAIMLPIAEMCAPKKANGVNHIRFISDILYIYNIENPINDFRINRTLQIKIDNYIRSKKPYESLDHL